MSAARYFFISIGVFVAFLPFTIVGMYVLARLTGMCPSMTSFSVMASLEEGLPGIALPIRHLICP